MELKFGVTVTLTADEWGQLRDLAGYLIDYEIENRLVLTDDELTLCKKIRHEESDT